MFLLLHNPNGTGAVRVATPGFTDQWVILGVAATPEEALTMANARSGSYVVVNLATGEVGDVFAYSLQKRNISKPTA